VLQSVAGCCRVLQSVAEGRRRHTDETCLGTLAGTATHCNTLQHTATHCNTLQHSAPHCATLHHTAPLCTTLHHAATRCNTLRHTDETWLGALAGKGRHGVAKHIDAPQHLSARISDIQQPVLRELDCVILSGGHIYMSICTHVYGVAKHIDGAQPLSACVSLRHAAVRRPST